MIDAPAIAMAETVSVRRRACDELVPVVLGERPDVAEERGVEQAEDHRRRE